MFGMVLNALWPLLANAGPAEFSAPICSMVGTKSTSGMGGSPGQPAPAKMGAAHCPFCAAGGDQNPALSSAEPLAFPPPIVIAKPLAAGVEFFPSVVSFAAHPRGPPLSLI
jgi:hypothetical protein